MKNFFLTLLLVIFTTLIQAQVVKDGIARALGDSIEQSLQRGDPSFLMNVFDAGRFASYFIHEEDNNPKLEELNSEFKSSNALIKGLTKGIIQQLKNEETYTFINYNNNQDTYVLRFRLYGDGGLNYHEYLLNFESHDEYYISDVYVYATGEYLSETMRPVYLSIAKDLIKDKDKVEKTNMDMQTLKVIRTINELLVRKKNKLAQKLYYGLPENVRNEDIMLNYELRLLDADDEEAYTKLLNKITSRSKTKSSLYLLSIDKFSMAKKYQKALSVIDSLDVYVADDLLDLYRANTYYLWEKRDSAEKYFLRTITNYPYLTNSYDQIIAFYMEDKKYQETVDILELMGQSYGATKKDIRKVYKKAYPSLVKSEAFKNWMKEE